MAAGQPAGQDEQDASESIRQEVYEGPMASVYRYLEDLPLDDIPPDPPQRTRREPRHRDQDMVTPVTAGFRESMT